MPHREGKERPTQSMTFDLSQELYGEGRAIEADLAHYIEVAKSKGILDQDALTLTGGTLVTIYMAIAAEAAKPGSRIQEIAFTSPREGRLVLWDNTHEKKTVPLKKSLMVDVEESKLDPTAPTEILDLRLLYRTDVEGPEILDPKNSDEAMQQITAQIRALRQTGVTTLRITGFPAWLAQGAAYIAVKEGIEKIIAFAPGKEVVVYDATNQMTGKIDTSKTERHTIVNPSGQQDDFTTWRDVQRILATYLPNNQIIIESVDLQRLHADAGLKLCDRAHVVAGGVTIEGVSVFNHQDTTIKDLVPKTPERNPDLLPREQRSDVIIDVHSFFEATHGDADATALAIAKIVVNTAIVVTFRAITTPMELAIAAKAAHAAHGAIDELRYQTPDGKNIVIKSWKAV